MKLSQLNESEQEGLAQLLQKLVDKGYQCIESRWRPEHPGDFEAFCKVYAVVRKPEEWPMRAAYQPWHIDHLCDGATLCTHVPDQKLAQMASSYIPSPSTSPEKLCGLCRGPTNLKCRCGFLCENCRGHEEEEENPDQAARDIFAVDVGDSWGDRILDCPECGEEIVYRFKLWWPISIPEMVAGISASEISPRWAEAQFAPLLRRANET